MRDSLYLSLSDSADGLYTYARTGALGAPLQPERAPLETIVAHAAGRQLVCFVPGTDVRLASVKVPARQPQKVLQAAPYALEEQLAEDVETLHFALGPRQPDGSHPVAVVARARMDAWLARLQARGVRPDALVPESLCLPWTDVRHWTGAADAGRVVVRTGAYAGFACPLNDLPMCLQLADPESRVPLRLFVSRDTDHDFTLLSRPVELLPGYGSALEVFVRHWRPEASINLLQGGYSGQEGWQRTLQPWRMAATLAGAWIAVAIVSDAVQGWKLGRELQAQETANLERFQALFPQERKIVDLAAQAEQQLAALRGGSGRAPLFQLLELLSQALGANAGLTLQSLQFREGALFLAMTASDVQALENLRGWFGGRSEALLEVQSTNAGGDGVQLRLKLALA